MFHKLGVRHKVSHYVMSATDHHLINNASITVGSHI